METITSRFELIVYDNGKRIEVRPIINNNYDLSECSSRISQILLTIMEMKRQFEVEDDQLSEMRIYLNAINSVASKEGVSENTVIDKISRQLNKTTEEFRVLVFNYLKSNDMSLKKELLNYTSNKKGKKIADIEAINKIIV